MAKFIEPQTLQPGIYGATTKNTGISQRDKLERSILFLADALGLETVSRASTRDSGYMHAMPGDLLQSASNTILSMSERLAKSVKERVK